MNLSNKEEKLKLTEQDAIRIVDEELSKLEEDDSPSIGEDFSKETKIFENVNLNDIIQDEVKEEDLPKPWWIVKLVVKYPIPVMVISMLLAFILAIIPISLGVKLDNRTDSFKVFENSDVKLWDAYLRAREVTTQVVEELVSLNGERSEPLGYLSIEYYLNQDADGKDIFTQDRLKYIKSIEDSIKNTPGYSDFCLLFTKKSIFNINGVTELPSSEWHEECKPPFSPINLFFPTLNDTEPRKYNLYNVYDFDGGGTELAPITSVKQVLATSLDTFGFFVDRRFTTWYRSSVATRSVFSFGMPLKGFNSTSGLELQEQRLKLLDFMLTIRPILRQTPQFGVSLVYYERELTNWEIDRIIINDGLLSLGAIVISIVYTAIHINSLSLAFAGMLQIIVSIPASLFFIRVVLQISTIGILHLMALFLIIAIGTDDIFVFMDTWYQSQTKGTFVNSCLLNRMNWVYRRACKAMFVTSFTTAIAFLTNVVSSILPIRLFGVYTAIIVTMNFLLILTWFPATLIIWNRYESKIKFFDIAKWKEFLYRNFKKLINRGSEKYFKKTLINKNESDLRFIERFFRDKYAPFIDRFKFIILAIFIMLMALSSVLCSFLKTSDKSPQFFPPGSNLYEYDYLRNNVFRLENNDNPDQIRFVFGILTIDRSLADPYDPQSLGEVVWDPNFKPDDINAQLFLQELCSEIESATLSSGKPLVLIHPDWCWPRVFKQWRLDRNLSFPIESSKEFFDELKNFTLRDPNPYDGITKDVTPNPGYVFRSSFGWTIETTAALQQLKWFAIFINSTMIPQSGTEETKTHFTAWNQFLNRIRPQIPLSLSSLYITCSRFPSVVFFETLLFTAFFGGIVSLVVTFFTLVFISGNFIVAFYSIITISGILVFLGGCVVLLQWEFSLIESIAVTTIVGMSVDYTVHISNAYVHSMEKGISRKEVLVISLTEIGISIFSGSLTTTCSIFMLFFTTITFFTRFGEFVFLNIVASIIFALTIQCALLAIGGPLRKQGNIYELLRKIKYKIFKKQKILEQSDIELK